MDYFTLLGMPNRFDIDKQQLASRYQEMQRQYHPIVLRVNLTKSKYKQFRLLRLSIRLIKP